MRTFANNIANTTHNAKAAIGARATSTASKARQLAKSFLKNESGSFATIFGVSTLAVFMSVGVAIDYSQISRSKSIVDISLDAAVLAAGNELLMTNASKAALKKVFKKHLEANLELHSELTDKVTIKSFSVDKSNGLISASLSTPVQMALMGIVGVPKMKFDSVSEARFSTTPVEVAMVLDVTGSMNSGGKLTSLKSAAKKAIDILLPTGANNSSVKIGLVPYSEGVRLSNTLAKKASGQNTYNCMTERTYNKYSDVSYSSEYVGYDNKANCSGNQLKPLTNNGKKLKNEITFLSASGYTAGHLGIAWGYYMLSEKWQNLWKGNSKPDDYGTNTKKIAILMTDGSFNTYFQGVTGDPTGPQQAKSANDAKGLCTDMKRPGHDIEIYSIAFNAPTSAKQILQNCATPNSSKTTYYYDANSQAELEAAFVEIAQSIKSLRLSK